MTVEDYFGHPRPEVRAMIPADARIVVDVGCGAGAVGAALKAERPGVQVRGIELNPDAAARARTVLDDVATATGEAPMPPGWPAPDCVVLADVLEHMVDPWAALARWRGVLRPGGVAVVSLPNVAHWTITDPLQAGRFDYEEEGLLDRTHLRFFTRATAVEMVVRAGFRIEALWRAVQIPADEGRARGWTRQVHEGMRREDAGRRVPGAILRTLDACTRQFIFRARAGVGGGASGGGP